MKRKSVLSAWLGIDDISSRIDDLEQQFKDIEQQVKTLNESIEDMPDTFDLHEVIKDHEKLEVEVDDVVRRVDELESDFERKSLEDAQ